MKGPIGDELCDCGHTLDSHFDYGDDSAAEWLCEACDDLKIGYRGSEWHEFRQSSPATS